MTTYTPEITLEERIAKLEERLVDTTAAVSARIEMFDSRLQRLEVGSRAPARPSAGADAWIAVAERSAQLDRRVARHAGVDSAAVTLSGLSSATPAARYGPIAAPTTPSRSITPPLDLLDASAEPVVLPVAASVDQPEAAAHLRAATSVVSGLSAASSWWRAGMSLSDLVGGRVLAWLGGVATLLGIVLFLVLAVSHGWVGHEARVLLAGAASAVLMIAGVWLHDHRGRTEAATVMAGTAIAGMFATLIVAGEVYGLIPALAAVAGSILVGGLATVLAIRWAGQAIGALGLVGALLSPVLVAAPADGATVAVLAVAAICAMWVVVWQRWGWLALAAVIICVPQLGVWALAGQPVLADVLVLAGFAALGLAGAIGLQLRSSEGRLVRSSAAVLVVSACAAAVIGRVALVTIAGATTGDVWLVALACSYTAAGAVRSRRARISLPLRQLLIGIAVTLADVAFALSAHGLVLAAGWSATAIAFAWLARRSPDGNHTDSLLDLGIGAHIALVLIRALVQAPPSGLATGNAQLLPILSVSMLAASCVACSRLTGERRTMQRTALAVLGVIAIGYLTASALGGAALVAVWAFEALSLTQLHSRTGDPVARFAGYVFLGAASLYATTVIAPPASLIAGAGDLGAAVVALGAVAIVSLRGGLMLPAASAQRRGLLIGAAATALYLASIAIITVFQPTSATAAGTLLDLSVRQQGQVALSALLSLVGLGALLIGLRRNIAVVRIAGMATLLLTVVKVFLYDLSTLTSGYRVISFIVLGLLLLAGAFAYQRLRPPPNPDMRTVHPSQR